MAAQRRSLMQSHQSWTDDLPLCQLCGVGSAPNCVYGPDGKGTQSHPNEDGHFCFSTDCCFLYGVFNGYDGSRVASFVSQCLTAELLLGQLSTGHTDADVRRILSQGVCLSAQTQKIAERLKALEQEVSGGATAIVALILNNKLYIANVGQSSTRRIGDYKVKFNYTDIDVLSAATQKPIISEPEIHGGQSLEGVTGFLLLMSEGLIKALESAHGPEQVNQEIVAMVAAELAQQSSLEAAAQSVVERVKRLHHDAYVSGRQRAPHCGRHEDMTLLIRVVNYTLADGSLTPTQGGRIYPVSVPYSNHQSTSKTSVMLSLVMPAQGTLTNGSNTASTLEGDTPTAGQSPTATLQSTNTHTQSSSSSSGDGSLFRQRGSQAAQPDETGRVPPYVDFTQFYRLWGSDHSEGQ
ncbi:hypothetical protein cypCar_00048055, partial [Cyprinus carpio]